ncbi:type II secretion system F family protein [Thiohalobacter sp. IOR34]|uniref:type II secretion system F family protein n=1 Tax=Thiohalobacter sp. IOR34 TaxID=3057176 RepID=UPI0025B12E54|nr:type II secretion system F family protein [Thiohalobacter sp. IOR34]WJW75533.1 type II secretion system F family protein [Thiohalobacter sp. IOR34]
MPLFNYKARGPHGDAIEGSQEAANADSVAARLMESGLTPIDITPAEAEKETGGSSLETLFPPKVQLADLIQFSRQMHSLTRAGVPIFNAFNVLAETSQNRTMRRVLGEVTRMLEAGHDLASAMSHHPEVFSQFFVSLIRVGETSGRLEEVFLQLAYYLEREKQTRDQIRSALRYPAFVLTAISIAIVVINIWVIPAFSLIFDKFDADLPLATRLLVGISNFMLQHWPLLLAGLVGSLVAVHFYLQSESGRYRWDKLKLRLPLIGDILYKATLSRFCRLFGMSQQAGVPLITSLTVVARALDNDFLEERVLGMREGIERGESISVTAANSGMFDPLVRQMIVVGEESGTLDELLMEIGRYYDQEVEYAIERLSSNIEPILTVVIGCMVLVLALAVFLPWWNLATAAMNR